MLETLNQIDKAVFLFFNTTLANPVTDFIMPVVTNDWGLRAFYGLAMLIVLWKGNARMRWMVLASALVLTLTDQIAAGYLKHLIERVRPCHTLADVNLLVGCGGGFAMPSAHAASSFGQAALWSWHYRKALWYVYALAALIALSRVFVGVHYPGDVLVGAVLGIIVGLLIASIFGRVYDALTKAKTE